MDVASVVTSAAVGAVASVVTSYLTTHIKARQELRKWRTELAEKYAALASEEPRKAQALARQFAVGVLVVEGPGIEREKVFLAPHTRITAGRAPDNEIVLPPSVPASRRHFAISADEGSAYVEDLGSANGTYLNQHRVSGRTRLERGDRITVAGVTVEFQPLASNVA